MSICNQCGDKIEEPGKLGFCYGCRLDGLIPRNYQRREDYQKDDAIGHSNATKHPKTGVQILDSTPIRLSQAPIPKSFNPRRL